MRSNSEVNRNVFRGGARLTTATNKPRTPFPLIPRRTQACSAAILAGIRGRRLLFLFFLIIIVASIIALVIYLVLRPTHPRFYLQDATLRQFDLTNGSTAAAGFLSTELQLTIASRNPNGRGGFYYDRLAVYARYKDQQVTVATALPPVYQGHGDVDVWSPVLTGPNVPFAPHLADALAKDVAAGYFIVEVKIDGRVRWRVGTWISGHYHIFFTCPAFFVTTGENGVVGANGLRFQTATFCRLEV